MSFNQAKYIKLSTEPWTGNIISNPTSSLTLQSVNTFNEVVLTEQDGDVLVNGVPISAGSGGVTSITADPTSIITVTPGSTPGTVTIGANTPPGISKINAGNFIALSPPSGVGDVEISSTGYVQDFLIDAPGFGVNNIDGNYEMGGPTNLQQTVEISQFGTNANVGETNYIPLYSLSLPGLYLLELQSMPPGNQDSLKYTCSFLIRAYSPFNIQCGGIHNPTIDDTGHCIRVYIEDPTQPSFLTIYTFTEYQLDVNCLIFRLI
jgi:hypothetical protein